MSYGKFGDADYAAVVHYDKTVFHPIGQAFYLQQPLFQATQRLCRTSSRQTLLTECYTIHRWKRRLKYGYGFRRPLEVDG